MSEPTHVSVPMEDARGMAALLRAWSDAPKVKRWADMLDPEPDVVASVQRAMVEQGVAWSIAVPEETIKKVLSLAADWLARQPTVQDILPVASQRMEDLRLLRGEPR